MFVKKAIFNGINVSKIGESFQRKLEKLRNNYAFKNLRLSTFPNHGLIRKRLKQLRIT